jgi:hypothetical protein
MNGVAGDALNGIRSNRSLRFLNQKYSFFFLSFLIFQGRTYTFGFGC